MSTQAQPRVSCEAQPRRLRAAGEPLHVLIDELHHRSVGYIVGEYVDHDSGQTYREPMGTVFFVHQWITHGLLGHYAVTARHVVEDISGDNNPLNRFIRVNTVQGKKDFPIPQEDWIFHPATDVAVCKVLYELAGLRAYDIYATPVRAQIGHDVFFIGLFSLLPGEQSVDAIVRFGKVCGSRTRVPIRLGVDQDVKLVDALLVESRSWGGESGSPVFLHDEYVETESGLERAFESEFRVNQIRRSRVSSAEVRPPLLGLLHGHFLMPESIIVDDRATHSQVEMNTGIGVVIPAEKIHETLMDDRLVGDRERRKAEWEKKKTICPKPD